MSKVVAFIYWDYSNRWEGILSSIRLVFCVKINHVTKHPKDLRRKLALFYSVLILILGKLLNLEQLDTLKVIKCKCAVAIKMGVQAACRTIQTFYGVSWFPWVFLDWCLLELCNPSFFLYSCSMVPLSSFCSKVKSVFFRKSKYGHNNFKSQCTAHAQKNLDHFQIQGLIKIGSTPVILNYFVHWRVISNHWTDSIFFYICTSIWKWVRWTAACWRGSRHIELI